MVKKQTEVKIDTAAIEAKLERKKIARVFIKDGKIIGLQFADGPRFSCKDGKIE